MIDKLTLWYLGSSVVDTSTPHVTERIILATSMPSPGDLASPTETPNHSRSSSKKSANSVNSNKHGEIFVDGIWPLI